MSLFGRVGGRAHFYFLILMLGAGAVPLTHAAPALTLTVQAGKPAHAISPNLYGVFFEDINYAADGGLYAELIQNRSFEFAGNDALYSWSVVQRNGAIGNISLETDRPINTNNSHYVRVQVGNIGDGIGISNEGYGGIVVEKGSNYLVSVWLRALDRSDNVVSVLLENSKKESLGSLTIVGVAPTWNRYTGKIKATASATNAHFIVMTSVPGTLDIDMVSLFPEHTFKNRPNGLRADLARMVADLKPSFVRFPGGCIVEGKDLSNGYRWKDTIGDVAERRANWNRWQNSQRDALAPHYNQSYGLGFYEFFQFCEDISAAPLPILNCGMSCQYQDKQLVPLDRLDPYIQDALDLIEFANGPANSPWGARRAAMGHPEPFQMKYLGVGNEQWGEEYFDRYERFVTVLKAKHPEIQIVGSGGPQPDGNWFDMAWSRLKGLNADLVDEHYYRPPAWFLAHADRYDHYDRNGPKVFAGEYAAHTPGKHNNMEAALSEAAFMTGLERNSDVVTMASYAPLFAKAGFVQWPVDLTWFDSTRVYGSPAYYVQKLFSVNRGEQLLPVELTDSSLAPTPSGQIVLATFHTDAEFKDVRVAKGSKTLFSSQFTRPSREWRASGGNWTVKDGKYRQSDTGSVASSVAGDADWSDYTLTLKARKLAGDEGFIIGFRRAENGSQIQWNLGGWGNRQHGIQDLTSGSDRIVEQIPGSIESDKWYDIKIELKGSKVSCYLDGALLQTADIPVASVPRFFATASRDPKTDQIIIKAVNPTGEPASTKVCLNGLERVGSKGQAIVLAATSPSDENSFAEPVKVAPVTAPLTGVAPEFRYKFKPYSLTILRISAER